MWKDIQGGHFIHGHYKWTFLNPMNIKPQCVACNKWRNGNLDVYAERLLKENGQQFLDDLRSESKQNFKPNRDYYYEKIEKFKKLIEPYEDVK